MAYKPPSQSIIDNETGALPSSEAVFEALRDKVDVTENYDIKPQWHDAGSVTGNFSVNFSLGPVQQVKIGASGTLDVTFLNPVAGGVYMLKVIHDGLSGDLGWPASVKWSADGAPTLSTASGDVDLINFVYDGSVYYGAYSLGY